MYTESAGEFWASTEQRCLFIDFKVILYAKSVHLLKIVS